MARFPSRLPPSYGRGGPSGRAGAHPQGPGRAGRPAHQAPSDPHPPAAPESDEESSLHADSEHTYSSSIESDAESESSVHEGDQQAQPVVHRPPLDPSQMPHLVITGSHQPQIPFNVPPDPLAGHPLPQHTPLDQPSLPMQELLARLEDNRRRWALGNQEQPGSSTNPSVPPPVRGLQDIPQHGSANPNPSGGLSLRGSLPDMERRFGFPGLSLSPLPSSQMSNNWPPPFQPHPPDSRFVSRHSPANPSTVRRQQPGDPLSKDLKRKRGDQDAGQDADHARRNDDNWRKKGPGGSGAGGGTAV